MKSRTDKDRVVPLLSLAGVPSNCCNLGVVLNVPRISCKPLRHLLACEIPSKEGERRLGSPGWPEASVTHAEFAHSCALGPSVSALSSNHRNHVRTSLRRWFHKKIKHESNSKLCHASCRIGAWFKTKDFFFYFLCLYDSSEFISLFWNLLKEKVPIKKETGFTMLALKLVISHRNPTETSNMVCPTESRWKHDLEQRDNGLQLQMHQLKRKSFCPQILPAFN